LRRLHGIAEERLIYVHPRDAALVEELEELVVLKRRMAHFERARVIGEGVEEIDELHASFRRVAKAPRKLQQDCAEAVGVHEWIEIVLERFHVVVRERRILVCESAKHFRREL